MWISASARFDAATIIVAAWPGLLPKSVESAQNRRARASVLAEAFDHLEVID
jgi:hypothetical protein